MATIYEVAERAGVSLATVSRVINGKQSVNEKLRKQVEEAMAELNYRPNSVARSLASNRSDSVGLLVSELDGPFFGEMMRAVEATLRKANKHVIITVGHNDREKEIDGIEFLISRNCDALILHAEGISDQELVDFNSKIPLVLVNRRVPELADQCISLNDQQGGYQATRHLLELGHSNIAYIAGPEQKHDACERLAGHKKALKEAGIEYNPKLFYRGDFKESGGADGLAYLLDQDEPFTALVCGNDWMASGAMTHARERGLALPDDLSIVGFDNVLFAHHVYPRLTTVNNPIDQMGEMAAKVVLNKVYKQKLTVQTAFSPELVVRHSAIATS